MRHALQNRLARRVLRVLAAACAGIALLGNPAAAQNGGNPLKVEYEALFQRILREPANVDVNFRFAEVSTRLGDYEAAVGALERILFYNPNLPRVKLELGVLYYRLGSYQMARSYFEGAVEGGAPPEIRERVESFLAEIDRRLAVTQWSVYAQTGLRWQSNANAGPNSPYVRALGRDAVLDRAFVKRPDWNAFAVGVVRHVYDFENQRGDVWETNVTGYYARQFEFQRLNLGYVEAQTGPRLAVAPDAWPGLSVRPYVLANAASLGGSYYFGSVGAGVSVSVPIAITTRIEPFVEYRGRRFDDTTDYPFASDQTGRIWTVGLVAEGDLFGRSVRWQARGAYSNNDARRDFYSYDQIALDVGLPIEFDGLWSGTRRWAFVPTFGFAHYDYDAPNPIVDPNRKRRDNEWRVGALLDAQLYEHFGLALQVQYAVVDSTLRNYDTRNFSVTFGPNVRF